MSDPIVSAVIAHWGLALEFSAAVFLAAPNYVKWRMGEGKWYSGWLVLAGFALEIDCLVRIGILVS